MIHALSLGLTLFVLWMLLSGVFTPLLLGFGVFSCVLVVLIALAAALFLVEWMVGCGETYIAADGQRYAHECVFLK